MELDVLFTYPVGYVPARCQNTRTAWFRSRTALTVREVPKSEAKLAFRIAGDGRFAPLRGRPRRMLAHGGKLWLEHGPAAEFAARFAKGDAVEGTPLDACKHLHKDYSGRELSNDNEAKIRRNNPGLMREWEDDGGAAMARSLSRRAEDMIVVGGTLYVRDYEPVWKADDRAGLKVTTVKPDGDDPFADQYGDYFANPDVLWRADRRDAAAASLENGPEAAGDAVIEVVDPSFVRYNDEGRRLVHEVGKAVDSVHRHLGVLPVEACEVFCDVRDAAAASRGGFGPALVDAAYRFAAADGIIVPPGRAHAAEAQRAWDDAVARCAAAVAKWEARPDDGREWQHHGLRVTATKQGELYVRELLDSESIERMARRSGIDLAGAEAAAASGLARLIEVGKDPSYVVSRDAQAGTALFVFKNGPDGPVPVGGYGIDGPPGDAQRAAALAHMYEAAPSAAPEPTTEARPAPCA